MDDPTYLPQSMQTFSVRKKSDTKAKEMLFCKKFLSGNISQCSTLIVINHSREVSEKTSGFRTAESQSWPRIHGLRWHPGTERMDTGTVPPQRQWALALCPSWSTIQVPAPVSLFLCSCSVGHAPRMGTESQNGRGWKGPVVII